MSDAPITDWYSPPASPEPPAARQSPKPDPPRRRLFSNPRPGNFSFYSNQAPPVPCPVVPPLPPSPPTPQVARPEPPEPSQPEVTQRPPNVPKIRFFTNNGRFSRRRPDISALGAILREHLQLPNLSPTSSDNESPGNNFFANFTSLEKDRPSWGSNPNLPND